MFSAPLRVFRSARRLTTWGIQAKPGIIKRILNALERFIARIRGKDAYLAVEQRQAAERLRDMLTGELKRAYGTDVKGEAAVESDGGKKYSIVYLDDGKTYVTASRNVISGNDVNQWRKQITNFFNALLEGNKSIDIETVEGDTLTITKKETARKARDNFKQENGKPVRMSDNEFRVKLNVEAHIDEIAETARSSKNTGSADTKSHAFAKDGFTYRTAYFEDFNGDYYRVRLSIGNNGTVATVYNVGKMTKDVPASAKILAVVGSKPLAVTSSDNRISQHSRNVNRQFSENSGAKVIEETTERLNEVSKPEKRFSLTRANDEYMKAVESGNVEEQQRLVDEAAENAGYDSSILLHHGTSKFGFTKIDVAESDDGISFFATDKFDTAASYIPYYENSDAYDGIREIGKRTGKNRKVLTADSSIEDFLKYLKGVYPEEYRDARVITKEERYKFAEWYVSDAVKQAKRLLQYSIPKNVEDLVNMVIESEDNKSQWESIARAYGSFKDIPEITYNGMYFNEASDIWHNLQDRIRLLNIDLTKDLAIVNELPKSKEELLYSYEQFTGGENVGIYGLYAKHEGQLVIRGGGSNWNNIPLGDITEKFNDWWVNEKGHEPADNGFYTRGNTRNIAEFAKFAGYRSVCFVDIYDIGAYGGGYGDLADIYAFFYPESDVKSADPITYDDSGNVIPLTERFDSGNRDIRWSLAGTTDGRPVAVIDKDILDGVPESEWKSVARKAISEGFPDGIAVQGKNIRVNQTTRREYTKSDYTQWLFNHSKGVFADKMRAAAKLDDVVLAATNWTKDGGLKHPRKDNFVDFGRGNVLMSIGGNKYSAEVILAYPQVGAPVLYDVVTLNPDSFDLINEKAASANANAATSGAHTTRFSSDISAPNTVSLTQNTPDVNSQYMRDGEKDSSSERHSLVKSAQSETETIEAEDKAIKNVLEKFSKERYYKSGYPYKFNEFLNRIADLSETSGERIPREQLLDTVKRLFRYAYENRLDGKALGRDYRHDADILAAMVGDIENEIYDWVSPLRDEYNEARDVKKKLRTEKIFVPTEIRASVAKAAGFETWSDFRKSLFGIVGLVNEQKGRALSEVYAELSEIYPEYFPDNITDGTEQAVLIADLARNMRVNGIGESNVLSYEEQLVKKSIGRAISELLYNGENTVSINAMRKRIAQLKEQREKAITSLKEKYAEQFKNRSEKQKQTVLRNKVLRKYTEASSMLDRPTTENHFTEAMREPLMEFLAAVDITTGKSVAKQGIYDRILRVIEAANKATAEGGKNGIDIAETDLNVQEKQLIVDSGLLERMSAWVEANKGKKLTELSSAQLFDQIVSNEPPVGYVHLDLLQQPYFAADTVRISYEQHTEKNLRLDSRASVILAVIRLADSAGTSFSNTILSQA